MYHIEWQDKVVVLNRNALTLSIQDLVPTRSASVAIQSNWEKRSAVVLNSFICDATNPRQQRSIAMLPTKLQTTIASFLREMDCRPDSLVLKRSGCTSALSTAARQWIGIDHILQQIHPISLQGKQYWNFQRNNGLLTDVDSIHQKAHVTMHLLTLGEHAIRSAEELLTQCTVPSTAAITSFQELRIWKGFLFFLEQYRSAGFATTTVQCQIQTIHQANQGLLNAIDSLICDANGLLNHGISTAWDSVRESITSLENQLQMLLFDTQRVLGTPSIQLSKSCDLWVAPRCIQPKLKSLNFPIVKITKQCVFFLSAELQEHVCQLQSRVAEAKILESTLVSTLFPALVDSTNALQLHAMSDVAVATARYIIQSDICWCQPNAATALSVCDLINPCIHNAVPLNITLEDPLSKVVLTGFNSSGKSTCMKSIGLAAALHQSIGLVPARKASLPIFKKILVRAGAQDSFAVGCSTFAMQLCELADIIQDGALDEEDQQLILLDELGANTNAMDGQALAVSTMSYLNSLTFLATHYNIASFKKHVNKCCCFSMNRNHTLSTTHQSVSNGWAYGIERGYIYSSNCPATKSATLR